MVLITVLGLLEEKWLGLLEGKCIMYSCLLKSSYGMVLMVGSQ